MEKGLNFKCTKQIQSKREFKSSLFKNKLLKQRNINTNKQKYFQKLSNQSNDWIQLIIVNKLNWNRWIQLCEVSFINILNKYMSYYGNLKLLKVLPFQFQTGLPLMKNSRQRQRWHPLTLKTLNENKILITLSDKPTRPSSPSN